VSVAEPGEVFGPQPGKAGPLVSGQPTPLSYAQPDPKDHSPKVRESGRKMGVTGTSFKGHAAALQSLLKRTHKYNT